MYPRTFFPLLPIAALLLSACAAHPVPSRAIDVSRAAIERAHAAGADRFAPEELARAREKVALIDRWLATRDHEPAQWLAEQAEVDAELARARAAAARAVHEALLLQSRHMTMAGGPARQ